MGRLTTRIGAINGLGLSGNRGEVGGAHVCIDDGAMTVVDPTGVNGY